MMPSRSAAARLALSVLATAAAAGSAASQEMPPPGQRPSILVTATATATLQPDHAVLELGVVTRGPTAAQAGERNADAVARVLAAVARLGIAEDAIQTARYQVQAEYDRQSGQRDLASYLAQNTVRVVVDDLDRIGAVIDAGMEAGANDVTSLGFGARRDAEARREALAEAVRTARLDAEAIAAAAGGRVGALLEVTTGGSAGPRPQMEMAFRAAQATTPVLPGELTVSATVTTRWAFVRGR